MNDPIDPSLVHCPTCERPKGKPCTLFTKLHETRLDDPPLHSARAQLARDVSLLLVEQRRLFDEYYSSKEAPPPLIQFAIGFAIGRLGRVISALTDGEGT